MLRCCLTVCILTLCVASPLRAENHVLLNADIYTVDAERSWAAALAMDADGVIIAVGNTADVLAAAGPVASVTDLDGRMVLPGFQDVHVHALEAGINADLCLFEAFDTLQGHKRNAQHCAETTPAGAWVLGANVNMFALLEWHPRPVEVLDAVIPDRPALILDDIGHGAWVNSAALARAGFDTAPDAENGNIILRSADGRPNGVVLENAQQALRTLAFAPTPDMLDFAYESLIDASYELSANGITSVSDAGGYWPQGHHQVWDRAETADALTVRAANALYIYPDVPLGAQLAQVKALYHDDPHRLVRFNTAKIYVDGILGQATAALLEPYEASVGLAPEEARGFLYFAETDLMRAAQELSAAGFQLHFHVIGDRAARLALDAIEGAAAGSGPHRFTHAYLVDAADRPRFAALGSIADLQLPPSALGGGYERFLKGLIGERAQELMPARALLDAGALVTFSSDWDADILSPLAKMKAAVQRRHNGFPDLESAITASTITAAIALDHADITGSIEVGKLADLVILSDNILDMPLGRIDRTRVDATLLGGEAVYDPSGLFD